MESEETPFPDLRFFQFKWLIAGVCAVIAALALVVFGQNESPDNPTAVIQQSLKNQQFYSGKITGEYDETTRDAVRRFQIRNGMEATSKLDAATLEAILAGDRKVVESAPPATPPPPPAEEIPARERARQFAEDDRQFLAELEGRPVSAKEEEPEEERKASAAAPTTPAKIKRKDAIQFLHSYLQAAQEPTPEQEISFFADEVKYFGDRKVSKASIAADQKAYYRRWPERKFTLVGEPQVSGAENGDSVIIFRIRYEVQRGDEKARGRTENIMRIRDRGDGPRIITIRERKMEG